MRGESEGRGQMEMCLVVYGPPESPLGRAYVATRLRRQVLYVTACTSVQLLSYCRAQSF